MGPKFLQLPESEWPKKSAQDVTPHARDNIIRLQKKTFVAVLTRSQQRAQDQARVQKAEFKVRKPPTVAAVQNILDEKRFSNLRWLIGTVAWTWRAVKKFLQGKAENKEKWEAAPPSVVITVNERDVAFRDVCPAAQESVHFPSTTIDRLVVYTDPSNGILMCGVRIQTFREDCKSVPLLPFHAWISTLLAREVWGFSSQLDGAAENMLLRK